MPATPGAGARKTSLAGPSSDAVVLASNTDADPIDQTPLDSPADFPSIWLFNDNEAFRQQLCAADSFRTIALDSKRLHERARLDTLVDELTRCKPAVVWIKLIGPHARDGSRHDRDMSRATARICYSQARWGSFVLEANFLSVFGI